MTYIPFQIAIDVSGHPLEKVIIGLIKLSLLDINKIMRNFKKSFPQYWRKKGYNLNHENLKEILEFLNNNKVQMRVLHFSGNDWHFYKSKLSKKGYVEEKIFGILYFKLLEDVTKEYNNYTVITCIESFMNINQVLNACNKLAKMKHRFFDFSFGHAKLNQAIKLADYVASSGRKLKKDDLKVYKNFKIIDKKIPLDYSKKTFNLTQSQTKKLKRYNL